MKTTIPEFRQNYPKLIKRFERETGKNAIWGNKITTNFIYWLKQRIKYKTLICPECNKEFNNKWALSTHKNWHNKIFRKKMIKKKLGKNNPMYGRDRSGKNNPMFGKRGAETGMFGVFGKDNPSFKEDAKYAANHLWIRKYYPPKDVCNNKCEICNTVRLDLDLAQFIHINKRNPNNPMIDYFYTCHYNKKDSCHRIYDKLDEETKKELLVGAITREEKLKRVREYMMEIKRS